MSGLTSHQLDRAYEVAGNWGGWSHEEAELIARALLMHRNGHTIPDGCEVMGCTQDAAAHHPIFFADMLYQVAMCDVHLEEMRVWLQEQIGPAALVSAADTKQGQA